MCSRKSSLCISLTSAISSIPLIATTTLTHEATIRVETCGILMTVSHISLTLIHIWWRLDREYTGEWDREKKECS